MRAPINAPPFYPAPRATRELAEQGNAPYTKKACLSCGYVRFMPRKDRSCGACLAAYGGSSAENSAERR